MSELQVIEQLIADYCTRNSITDFEVKFAGNTQQQQGEDNLRVPNVILNELKVYVNKLVAFSVTNYEIVNYDPNSVQFYSRVILERESFLKKCYTDLVLAGF